MNDDDPILYSQAAMPRSKYTYRHLSVLSSTSPAKESPLRVIALCDLDCFYAQVEGVRVKADPEEPLAVSQWGGLIAINYAARAAGISRHENALSAVQKCPGIRLVHVQTWKEGDTVSRYHDEPTVIDHKVSLDPYRRESRRILEIFKKHCEHVEKASIDESFLDLSTLVKTKLLERYSHLLGVVPGNLDTCLPEAPLVSWEPGIGVLVDLDADHKEDDDNDWDDVIMHIAGEIMSTIRQDVKDTLGYTCSAGIARNKTLAKIAAGQNKPAKQTILRNRAVQSFLNGLSFTKIRNLGGKLGVEVERLFATSSVKDITAISIEDLRRKLGTDTGQWLYNIVRGIDYSEVSTNTQVKSMLSAKSFRPQIDTVAQAERWIKVLAADLASRLQEDPNQRRPKTLTMHHRIPGSSKTRQAPVPRAVDLSNEFLASLSMKLLMQINSEGRAFPCFNLSLGLSGFEGLEAGVQNIVGFFRKSSKTEDIKSPSENLEPPPQEMMRTTSSDALDPEELVVLREKADNADDTDLMAQKGPYSPPAINPLSDSKATEIGSVVDGSFKCDRCNKSVFGETEVEHSDWHFAKELSRNLARSEQSGDKASAPGRVDSRNGTKRPAARATKGKASVEKGQKRLKF